MALRFITRHFSRDLGIDLGTATCLIYERGRGITVREPSVVAVRRGPGHEILAVGEEARQMIGRTPEDIQAIRPLREGVIADFDVTREMIRHFIRKATHGRPFFKPRVVVSVPTQTTEVERRAVIEATLWAGAREAYLIEEPVAAAIGAGLPIHEASGNMIVDVGGGTTDIAVISLGGIVTGQAIRVGGDAMDDAVARYVRRKFNLMIGERTAEEVKTSIGWAVDPPEDTVTDVRGRDYISGLPRTVEVRSSEIFEALAETLDVIISGVRMLLERTPPELVSDIMDKEIIATGGGSLLNGFAERLSHEVKMPVKVADSPVDCVAIGIGKTLENLGVYHRIFVAERKAAT